MAVIFCKIHEDDNRRKGENSVRNCKGGGVQDLLADMAANTSIWPQQPATNQDLKILQNKTKNKPQQREKVNSDMELTNYFLTE